MRFTLLNVFHFEIKYSGETISPEQKILIMKGIILYLLLPLILALIPFDAMGQVTTNQRYTEEEVNLQKLYIEAGREKHLRKYENAAFLYEEVIKKDRDNPAPHYELARIYDLMEKPEEAKKSIETAIRLDDDNPWYKIYFAELLEKSGMDLDAARIYSNLAKLDPRNDNYYIKQAFHLVKAGEGEQAIEVFNQLQALMGVQEDISFRKHKIWDQMGKKKEAAAELDELSKEFPLRIDVKHQLATYYVQNNNRKAAKKIYEDILELSPEDARATVALASFDTGKTNDLGYLETLKGLFENEDVLIDVKIGKLLPFLQEVNPNRSQSEWQALINLGEVLTSVHSSQAKAFSVFGDLLYFNNQFDEALVQYKAALDLDDTVFSVWENLMTIYKSQYRFKELMDLSEEAMDYFPNQGASFYYNAWASAQLGKYQDAIGTYELGLMMSSKNVFLAMDIYTGLGEAYNRLGLYDPSEKAFQSALRLNSKAPGVMAAYAGSLAQQGLNMKKAKELAESANKVLRNDPEVEKAMGIVYYHSGDYEKASEWFKKAVVNSQEKSPEILELAGNALFQLGKVDVAIGQWKKALDIKGKDGVLEKKIANRQL